MAFRAAVIQHPPVMLDRAATIERALALIEEASRGGAQLILFPETWVPGYPTWAWRLRPGEDRALAAEIHGRLQKEAVDLARDDLAPVREAAKAHRVTVALGVHEIDGSFSRSTLYNTVVLIGPGGEVLNRHRKLMPTEPERMIWGMGDASGLRVVETPLGRIGALICWENYMPLARFALYTEGVEVYLAPTWDASSTWTATLRHIAKEGGCWVLGTATAVEEADIPADFPGRDRLFRKGEWINRGNATVVAPGGEIVAGPLAKEKAILYAEIDPAEARRTRRMLDVAGHYGRPDLFHLEIDRRPLRPVRFDD